MSRFEQWVQDIRARYICWRYGHKHEGRTIYRGLGGHVWEGANHDICKRCLRPRPKRIDKE